MRPVLIDAKVSLSDSSSQESSRAYDILEMERCKLPATLPPLSLARREAVAAITVVDITADLIFVIKVNCPKQAQKSRNALAAWWGHGGHLAATIAIAGDAGSDGRRLHPPLSGRLLGPRAVARAWHGMAQPAWPGQATRP